jgi:type II secretory pathway pseudopilin PulG
MRPAAGRQLVGWRGSVLRWGVHEDTRRRRTEERGFGLVEIVLVLVVVAVAGFLLIRYLGSTAKTVEKIQEERPIANARLMADQATLATIQDMVRTYQAQNGRWPADKATVLALLQGQPRFQCAGNDFEYDPTTGAVQLLISDSARC